MFPSLGSGTETIAHQQADGTYKLYGYKWFTSATDANMTLTLARVADPEGHTLQVSVHQVSFITS